MASLAQKQPDWSQLFEIASAQEGLFTTQQAAEAGYSPQLLAHHVAAKRMLRVRRGVYRLVHFPSGDYEELTAIWLWSERVGVFSHGTALALHHLSDALPSRVDLTVPSGWRRRRLRVPDQVVLHFGDVDEGARQWFGPVPATAPLRTLEDCARQPVSPELLRASTYDALERGLVLQDELEAVEVALAPFGGLEP